MDRNKFSSKYCFIKLFPEVNKHIQFIYFIIRMLRWNAGRKLFKLRHDISIIEVSLTSSIWSHQSIKTISQGPPGLRNHLPIGWQLVFTYRTRRTCRLRLFQWRPMADTLNSVTARCASATSLLLCLTSHVLLLFLLWLFCPLKSHALWLCLIPAPVFCLTSAALCGLKMTSLPPFSCLLLLPAGAAALHSDVSVLLLGTAILLLSFLSWACRPLLLSTRCCWTVDDNTLSSPQLSPGWSCCWVETGEGGWRVNLGTCCCCCKWWREDATPLPPPPPPSPPAVSDVWCGLSSRSEPASALEALSAPHTRVLRDWPMAWTRDATRAAGNRQN